MGILVQGKWQSEANYANEQGRFVRQESRFRSWVTADGLAGPTGEAGFRGEAGRYHLYVSLACPWAHRTLFLRAIKGLETMIGVSVVHPLMLENGWEFRTGFDGATGDRLYGFDKLWQLYLKADPGYSGRVTVPTLWDRKRETIVSNESAEILRMLNSAFDALGARPGDYCPADLLADIDATNAHVYDRVNNGVYKAGFATSQAAYDEAATALFDALDTLEQRLGKQRYLVGDTLTEADIRLWTTLVRFDAVYATHFKCDKKRIADYPNLSGLLRELYQMPGVADTVHMDHIRHHYFKSHRMINPNGILSIGPDLDFTAPHHRDRLGPGHIRNS